MATRGPRAPELYERRRMKPPVSDNTLTPITVSFWVPRCANLLSSPDDHVSHLLPLGCRLHLSATRLPWFRFLESGPIRLDCLPLVIEWLFHSATRARERGSCPGCSGDGSRHGLCGRLLRWRGGDSRSACQMTIGFSSAGHVIARNAGARQRGRFGASGRRGREMNILHGKSGWRGAAWRRRRRRRKAVSQARWGHASPRCPM